MDAPVDFLLVTALQDEFVALLAQFPEARRRDKGVHDVLTYYEAGVPTTRSDGTQYRVVLTCLPRMGPVVAAIHVTAAVTRWQPNVVLLVAEIAAGKKAVGEQRAGTEPTTEQAECGTI